MHQATLLVVEDQADYRDLLELLLRNEGFIVAPAQDGAQAINLLTQIRPSLILTDLMMPNVSGDELIRHVRAHSEISNIPIMVMTAGDTEWVKKAKAAGADEVIRKPVDLGALLTTVRKFTHPSPTSP